MKNYTTILRFVVAYFNAQLPHARRAGVVGGSATPLRASKLGFEISLHSVNDRSLYLDLIECHTQKNSNF